MRVRVWHFAFVMIGMAVADEIDDEIVKDLDFFQMMELVEAKEVQQMLTEMPEEAQIEKENGDENE